MRLIGHMTLSLVTSTLQKKMNNCCFYSNCLAKIKKFSKDLKYYNKNKSFYNFFTNLASKG